MPEIIFGARVNTISRAVPVLDDQIGGFIVSPDLKGQVRGQREVIGKVYVPTHSLRSVYSICRITFIDPFEYIDVDGEVPCVYRVKIADEFKAGVDGPFQILSDGEGHVIHR